MFPAPLHRSTHEPTSASLRVSGEQRIAAVVDGAGRRTRCKWLLLNGDNCIERPAEPAQGGEAAGAEAAEATTTIARCVCVLDAPLVPSSEEDGNLSLSLLFQVPGREAATVYVLQQDHASAVCPAGSVLLHLSAEGVAGSTAQEQLEPALQLLRQHAAAHRATTLTEAPPGTAEAATAEATPATAEEAPAGTPSSAIAPPPRRRLGLQRRLTTGRFLRLAAILRDRRGLLGGRWGRLGRK